MIHLAAKFSHFTPKLSHFTKPVAPSQSARQRIIMLVLGLGCRPVPGCEATRWRWVHCCDRPVHPPPPPRINPWRTESKFMSRS